MFISELLYRTLLHSERDEELYDFLEDAVLRLEALEGSPANFHLWFIDRYTAFLGFPFERGFNLDYNPFTPQQTVRLRALHEAAFEEVMALPMTGVDRKELIEAVIRWLEYHTGSRIELRSISVLHQIYPSCTRYRNSVDFFSFFSNYHYLRLSFIYKYGKSCQ